MHFRGGDLGPKPTFGTEKLPFRDWADRNPQFFRANLCTEPTFGGGFEPQTFRGRAKKQTVHVTKFCRVAMQSFVTMQKRCLPWLPLYLAAYLG